VAVEFRDLRWAIVASQHRSLRQAAETLFASLTSRSARGCGACVLVMVSGTGRALSTRGRGWRGFGQAAGALLRIHSDRRERFVLINEQRDRLRRPVLVGQRAGVPQEDERAGDRVVAG